MKKPYFFRFADENGDWKIKQKKAGFGAVQH